MQVEHCDGGRVLVTVGYRRKKGGGGGGEVRCMGIEVEGGKGGMSLCGNGEMGASSGLFSDSLHIYI